MDAIERGRREKEDDLAARPPSQRDFLFMLALVAVIVSALVAVLALPGCGSISDQYVAGDEATYQAIAPEYESYVEADPALDEGQRENRLRTLRSWRLRIDTAKGKGESKEAGDVKPD